MELAEINGLVITRKYKDIFINNNMTDFYSIYNYESSKYFTKNPLRNVISFALGGNRFFLKRHRENYFFSKRCSPAKMEWNNISLLERAGIKTVLPVAYGEIVQGRRNRLSFIITEKIENAISLEEYILNKPKIGRIDKEELIRKLAFLLNRFHRLGFCHQDCYAGHIFLKNDQMYLIDVQRLLTNIKRKRWFVKDIAQLNYSIPKAAAGNTDRIRFLKYYFGISRLDKRAKIFIKKVREKTEKIRRHTEKLIQKGI